MIKNSHNLVWKQLLYILMYGHSNSCAFIGVRMIFCKPRSITLAFQVTIFYRPISVSYFHWGGIGQIYSNICHLFVWSCVTKSFSSSWQPWLRLMLGFDWGRTGFKTWSLTLMVNTEVLQTAEKLLKKPGGLVNCLETFCIGCTCNRCADVIVNVITTLKASFEAWTNVWSGRV